MKELSKLAREMLEQLVNSEELEELKRDRNAILLKLQTDDTPDGNELTAFLEIDPDAEVDGAKDSARRARAGACRLIPGGISSSGARTTHPPWQRCRFLGWQGVWRACW